MSIKTNTYNKFTSASMLPTLISESNTSKNDFTLICKEIEPYPASAQNNQNKTQHKFF